MSAEITEQRRTSTVADGAARYECPRCSSQDIWRNGKNSAGNQQYRCCTCGRVFVTDPHKPREIKTIADRLLIEGVAVPVITRVLHGFVSRRWLYARRQSLALRGYINV